jgi:hypothetical protein
MTKDCATHTIVAVEPKNPEYHNPYHQKMVNRPCLIFDATPGCMGIFLVDVDYDETKMHTFFTSRVLGSTYDDVSGILTIETENTVYQFREIKTERILCQTK